MINKSNFDKNLKSMSNSTFMTNNRFIVNLINKNFEFNPYEIDFFTEKKEKRIILNIRYTLENIEQINKLVYMNHHILPNFLVKQSEKFEINLSLLDSLMKSRKTIKYTNCVLKNIKYPELQYTNKFAQSLMTISCEFKYSNKTEEFFNIKPKELTKEDKVKINAIIDNENLLLEEALKKTKEHYKSEANKTYQDIRKMIQYAKYQNSKNRFTNLEYSI